MQNEGRTPRLGRRRRGAAALVLVLPILLGVAWAAKPQRDDVHRPDAECGRCHTADRDSLERDRLAARALLASDLEARCTVCHDEGPSHHTGIPPKGPVPDTLPLSIDGRITCATCHFIHGEADPFGSFVRIDNARGGLCLTCHQLSDLE